MTRRPVAVNALGEIICSGCGAHFVPTTPRVYCSQRCRQRAYRRGGRWTWAEVRARLRELTA